MKLARAGPIHHKITRMSVPLFKFGVIADVQWADKDNGHNFAKTRTRYYRSALKCLEGGCRWWDLEGIGEKSDFIVQLGDLVDGHNKALGQSREAMKAAIDLLAGCKCKQLHHLVGNHEFYNFSRKQLEGYGYGKDGKLYYSFQPVSGWRIVILDAYDISICGRTRGDDLHKEAIRQLSEGNPNNLNGGEWFKGLKGVEQRFVPYNGAISVTQLKWLEDVLKESNKVGEKVILMSHIPIFPNSTGPKTLLWNFQQVLDIVEHHPCVVASFAGHDHGGGYAVQRLSSGNVHHFVLPSPLESEPGIDAFGIVNVYSDKIVINGKGRMTSLTFHFDL